MKHKTSMAERSVRDPRFADERKAALAELALGEVLIRRRLERDVSLLELADTTGIPQDRLEAIEAGDSLTLHEVLWLVHALDAPVSIGAGFTVYSGAPPGDKQEADVTKFGSRTGRPPKAATA